MFDIKQLFFLHVSLQEYKNYSQLEQLSNICNTRYRNYYMYRVPSNYVYDIISARIFVFIWLLNFFISLPINMKGELKLNVFKNKIKFFLIERDRLEIRKKIDLKNV